MSLPMIPTYYKGHVRRPDKNHLQGLSHRRNATILQALCAIPTPTSWDSRTLDWAPPIDNQEQCGSCHDKITEVLTEKGWISWPEYDWKTPLGTMNIESGLLEFQEPLERHVYNHDGPMYYNEGRSLDFAVTPNHKMIWSRNKKSWVKSAIADLPVYVDIPHATRGWAGTELEKLGVGTTSYAGDDFLALIALVISCGHVGHRDDGNGTRNNITFCCFKENEIEKVRALANRLHIPEQASRPGVFYFRDASLAEWFRQNAYNEGGFTASYKHVPTLVKCASQRQIAHFLEMFGDQHTQTYGGRRFYSCSSLMIDDLQELLLRIGKRGTVEENPPRTRETEDGRVFRGNYPEFMLTERKRDALCIERENLKIENYTGKVYCATVPNGTLITRRNKSILVSSNCWDFSGTDTVTVAYWKAGLTNILLSKQYTLSCGRNGGCGGDDNTTVLEWAKSTGLPTTADYGSYTGSRGSCKFKSGMTLYKIDDWGFANSSGDTGQTVTPTADIKAAIMEYGCVGCAVAAGGDNFWDTGLGTGVARSNSIDHDVILIGWDDNHDNGDGSQGAWIMRNSWGTGWGIAGYAWIKYGAYDIGTEAVWAKVNTKAPAIDWGTI